MVTYTDKSGNIETLTKDDLMELKGSIYFTCFYTQGGTFRCIDEFGDCTIAILDVVDDKYTINAFDNWHICGDVEVTLTIEQLVKFIVEGGY